ncbi:MAG: hypothetical protein B6245_05900 [Desulfobacteraceae bacterium 4572_88]|nr:MAG: hypothetical protein B6245_05900 [Desulfobacteraceae bacterium 4572_88]
MNGFGFQHFSEKKAGACLLCMIFGEHILKSGWENTRRCEKGGTIIRMLIILSQISGTAEACGLSGQG